MQHAGVSPPTPYPQGKRASWRRTSEALTEGEAGSADTAQTAMEYTFFH